MHAASHVEAYPLQYLLVRLILLDQSTLSFASCDQCKSSVALSGPTFAPTPLEAVCLWMCPLCPSPDTGLRGYVCLFPNRFFGSFKALQVVPKLENQTERPDSDSRGRKTYVYVKTKKALRTYKQKENTVPSAKERTTSSKPSSPPQKRVTNHKINKNPKTKE
eukprot:m.30203 g.30203  ORF g.30203 m.30203 type:complete len:163 (+) comp9260_c0_seq3:2131-2619(+)